MPTDTKEKPALELDANGLIRAEDAARSKPHNTVRLMQQQYNVSKRDVEEYQRNRKAVLRWTPRVAKMGEMVREFRGHQEKLVSNLEAQAHQVGVGVKSLKTFASGLDGYGKPTAKPYSGDIDAAFEEFKKVVKAGQTLINKTRALWRHIKPAYERMNTDTGD